MRRLEMGPDPPKLPGNVNHLRSSILADLWGVRGETW